jgi:hypothetical protein
VAGAGHRAGEGAVARGRQHEHRRGDRLARERGEPLRARGVERVDHGEGRPARRADVVQRRAVRGDARSLAVDLPGELGGQPRAPDALRAREDHHRAVSAARPVPRLVQDGQLGLPADEGPGGLELGGQLGRGRPGEGRVLAQDRGVKLAQLGSRLDPDLLHEDLSRPPVGGERVGLPTGPVEREHEVPVEALAERVLGHEALELPRHLPVPALGQLLLGGPLERREPQLLQAPDLRGRERLPGQVGQRRAAPEGERLPRRPRGHQPLEADGVHGVGRDLQLVRPPTGHDVRAVAVAVAVRKRAPQVGDVLLDHLRRAGRQRLLPQALHELVRRDGTVGAEREHRQHGTLLRGTERDGPPAGAGLHGTEQAQLHDVSRRR